MPAKETAPPLPPWAERIKEARVRANLTQRQLGERIMRSQQAVNGYESGGREPDVPMYRAIAKICGVHPAWLIFGDDVVRGDPCSNHTVAGIIAEGQKDSRYFVWAFQQAAQFLAQENVDADFAYLIAYTQKILGAVNNDADETGARQAILRAIDLDRQEFRRNMDEARKRLL